MSSLALFDLAVSATQPSGEIRLAERLVESSLSDLRYLRELDASFAPSPKHAFQREAAVVLRALYEDWARGADAALQRVSRIERQGRSVSGYAELRDAHGQVMAMLSTSLPETDRARGQMARGETSEMQEVRGELQARLQR
jgi:hypothetical protein